jgi:hypothetical protein
MIANGYTVIVADGQQVPFSLNANESIVYLLDMLYGETYIQTVAATGSAFITNQQRFGPPQVNYVDIEPGVLQYSGGPEMIAGDIQRMAIKIENTAGQPIEGYIKISFAD